MEQYKPSKKLTGSKERLLVQTVPQDSERNVTKAGEDDDHGDENSKRVEIILVVQAVKIAGQEVVEEGDDPRRSDGIVSAYVTADGDLLGEGDAGAQEFPEEWRYRASSEPVPQRVEHQLIATVGILLPARQFVVYCQRHTFLEPIARVRGKAADVTGTLESKRHVEVLRDVRFGPEFLVTVLVMV
jgi:hypothetical protein